MLADIKNLCIFVSDNKTKFKTKNYELSRIKHINPIT